MSTISAGTTSGTALVSAGDTSGNLELQSSGVTKLTVGSGGVTLASALPVASGGTGASSLTANNVLLGNGTSAVQVVAPGSSGNVLTSNGTTWTSATPASAALILISTQTVSGTPTTVDFTSGISSTYDDYLIIFENARSSTNNQSLDIRLYKSGAFQTSGYNYQYTEARNSTTTAISGVGNNGAAQILTDSGNTNATNTYQAGRVFLQNVNSATANACTVMTETAGMGGLVGENYIARAGGSQNTAAVVTGIRFLWSGGTFTSGTFRLYGVAK